MENSLVFCIRCLLLPICYDLLLLGLTQATNFKGPAADNLIAYWPISGKFSKFNKAGVDIDGQHIFQSTKGEVSKKSYIPPNKKYGPFDQATEIFLLQSPPVNSNDSNDFLTDTNTLSTEFASYFQTKTQLSFYIFDPKNITSSTEINFYLRLMDTFEISRPCKEIGSCKVVKYFNFSIGPDFDDSNNNEKFIKYEFKIDFSDGSSENHKFIEGDPADNPVWQFISIGIDLADQKEISLWTKEHGIRGKKKITGGPAIFHGHYELSLTIFRFIAEFPIPPIALACLSLHSATLTRSEVLLLRCVCNHGGKCPWKSGFQGWPSTIAYWPLRRDYEPWFEQLSMEEHKHRVENWKEFENQDTNASFPGTNGYLDKGYPTELLQNVHLKVNSAGVRVANFFLQFFLHFSGDIKNESTVLTLYGANEELLRFGQSKVSVSCSKSYEHATVYEAALKIKNNDWNFVKISFNSKKRQLFLSIIDNWLNETQTLVENVELFSYLANDLSIKITPDKTTRLSCMVLLNESASEAMDLLNICARNDGSLASQDDLNQRNKVTWQPEPIEDSPRINYPICGDKSKRSTLKYKFRSERPTVIFPKLTRPPTTATTTTASTTQITQTPSPTTKQLLKNSTMARFLSFQTLFLYMVASVFFCS